MVGPAPSAMLLLLVVLLLHCGPSIQRGPQFYFTNPQAQGQGQAQERFVPSTFPQPAPDDQYRGFFQPLGPASGGFPGFRPAVASPPAASAAPEVQPFRVQNFRQQAPPVPPALEPSPFQLPPNSRGQAHPQQYSTFQAINPPAAGPARLEPFFQQAPTSFSEFQNPHSSFNARHPQFPGSTAQPSRHPSFLDQITLSPSGFSGSSPPRDPNNLRVIPNYSRGQQQEQFGAREQQQKRPPVNLDSSSRAQDTRKFQRPFPPDEDERLNTFVDQHLEVEDTSTTDPKLSSDASPTRPKDRASDAALRKKPGTRAQAGSRNNFIAPQRLRPTTEDPKFIQNDSFQNDGSEGSISSSRFRGRNRENRYHTTPEVTSPTPPPFPPRTRNQFTTTPPNKIIPFTVRPTKLPFDPKRFHSSSTTEAEADAEAEQEPEISGEQYNGETQYDETYDQINSSHNEHTVETTTNSNHKITTFRYGTDERPFTVLNHTDINQESLNSEIQSNPHQVINQDNSNETHLNNFTNTTNDEDKSFEANSPENQDDPTHGLHEEEDTSILKYDTPDTEQEPAVAVPPINHTNIASAEVTGNFNEKVPDTHFQGNDTGSFEILTMNPQHALVEQDNFKGFVDSVLIDATEVPHPPTSISDGVTEEPDDTSHSAHSTVTMKQTQPTTAIPNSQKDPMEEAVVSVVTTKSVINGSSMVVTVPPVAQLGEQLTSPNQSQESPDSSIATPTESWVIVASVQTSRSVSGARFLPSGIIRQEERILPVSSKFASSEHPSSSEVPERSELPETELPETSETVTDNSKNLSNSSSAPVSTESIIDKLDRVQSELSSRILAGGSGSDVQLEVLTETSSHPPGEQTEPESSTTSTTPRKSPVMIRKFTPHRTTPAPKKNAASLDNAQMDDLTGLLPPGFKIRPPGRRISTTTSTTPSAAAKPSKLNDLLNRPQGDQGSRPNFSGTRTSGGRSSAISSLQNKVKTQDVSSLLPPDYKPPHGEGNGTAKHISIEDLISNIKFQDVSALLPAGFNSTARNTSTQTSAAAPREDKPKGIEALLNKAKQDDIGAFLPPGYKPQAKEISTTTTTEKPKGVEALFNKAKQDDISAFLPPGYKPQTKEPSTTTEVPKSLDALFNKAQKDDISAFLPPGYKRQEKEASTTTEKPKGLESLFNKAKQDDISGFLPPGYKPLAKEPSSTTEKPKGIEGLLKEANPVDISAFLPPGFKLPSTTIKPSDELDLASHFATETTTKSYKVVFPGRPGGRKTTTHTTTTPKPLASPKPTLPTIKGWVTRSTTEFTGWPTPSTTPISLEKLLEAARTASTSTESTSPSTTTTTTTTTTTQRPTTPGICTSECDLAGTIKLVGGVEWVPELLDHNTREWQELANEVQSQLDSVFSRSETLSLWYRKVRIDDFSQGSVLVDYFVELTELGRSVDTQELKRLFHESLTESDPIIDLENDTDSAGASNSSDYFSSVDLDYKLKLGNFVVDTEYTDFIVLPRRIEPTVGYAEDDVLLPQWAIAGIVIGLASLLFVIIFGVTVLVNRHKNNKKKQPVPLTEDMLNELNKNHMGGFDNYAAEDLYNMEDVWNEKPYEKPPKKRSSASLQENSMSNLYDSWRSEWNGYYYNAYYGNGSSASGYARRRSDYDTNF